MNTEIETLTNLVTHSLEQINKSIVPDEVDKNDLNCITDVNEWLETVKQIDIATKNAVGTGPNDDRVPDIFKQYQYHLNFDYEIIKNASGYITAPVFTYQTKVAVSGSNVFNSMQELKDFLLGKKYLLYMVISSIQANSIGTIDAGIYTIIPNRPLFGAPEIKYTFRGHILE
jgi:hypothetical protein